jgi:hypothetical protein
MLTTYAAEFRSQDSGKKAEALAEFSKVLGANPSHAAARMAIENRRK